LEFEINYKNVAPTLKEKFTPSSFSSPPAVLEF
jgi:hypothetical protein